MQTMEKKVEIHLYGKLRKLIPDSSLSEQTIIWLELSNEETYLTKIISEIGLHQSDVQNCFVNGHLVNRNIMVKSGDRVGLFPPEMDLIDGALYIRYW